MPATSISAHHPRLAQPRLWALSDLHTSHRLNRERLEALTAPCQDDWLIVAGDVAERSDEIIAILTILARRFAQVIWVPGNHELWTTAKDPIQLTGQERYEYLVHACDKLGILTPEHPFACWTGPGGPAQIVPLFIGYDYSFLPPGAPTTYQALQDAHRAHVVATDEFLLAPRPYQNMGEWCSHRLEVSRIRLEKLDWMTPVVFINHFPLVAEPCQALMYPQFCLWCGTTGTADWHQRYNAICVVYGHLHIPRTTYYDQVRFEEVSWGYPPEWQRRPPHRWLRQILPEPVYPPGYLNEFGGHFPITDQLRAYVQAIKKRKHP